MRESEGEAGHGSTRFLDAAPPADRSRIAATTDAPQAERLPPRPPGSRRIGVVGNPRSHGYRSLHEVDGVIGTAFAHAEPSTPDGLRATLSRFAASGVDLLVVQGGDGTLRDVLTALPAAYGTTPPELAILATGNTNLAARVFGRIPPGPRGLARLAAAAQSNRLQRRTCRTLLVSWPADPERPALRGLFLGACLYADGKRLADARIHRSGVHEGPAVALAVLSALAGALLRRDGILRRGSWRRITTDGQALEGEGLVVLATTLDRLMLGFWPFSDSGGGGAIRWLDIDAPPRSLSRILLRMLFRREASARRPGHRSGRSDRIALELDGPFVLDGEFFDTGAGGIVLSDGGSVTIVSA